METRANYLLIGVFTLAVIFGAFGFVWWFQRAGDAAGRASYEIVYDGSVSGLRKGSVVNFNGIRVGEVYRLDLDGGNPHRVIAQIGVAANTPIRADTKAGLEFQGLTGIASVTLTGGKSDAPKLEGEGGKPPRLVADPSQMQDLMQAARALIARVDKILVDNEQRLNDIMKNVAGFTDELNTSGKELIKNGATMVTDLSAAAKSVRELADNLGEAATPTLKEYRLLAVDARRTAADISRFVRQLEQNPSQIIFGKRSGAAGATANPEDQPLLTPRPAQQKQKQAPGRPVSGAAGRP
ncbi:MAG TPA: MlaD family protein [Xanthobacteraceae bacterium]|nr:MlaD family protein [Xanthobacteraceae bacterium]